MDVQWIAAVASGIAALCAAVAWRAVRSNARTLQEIKRAVNERWTESLDERGRSERAVGTLQGIQTERLDNVARLEEVAAKGVITTELPSQVRVPNGSE